MWIHTHQDTPKAGWSSPWVYHFSEALWGDGSLRQENILKPKWTLSQTRGKALKVTLCTHTHERQTSSSHTSCIPTHIKPRASFRELQGIQRSEVRALYTTQSASAAKWIPVLQGQEINYEGVTRVNLLAKRVKNKLNLIQTVPQSLCTSWVFFFSPSF